MVVPPGIPLETVTWSKLIEQNSYEMNGDKGPLIVALVLRTGIYIYTSICFEGQVSYVVSNQIEKD
jgi:apolipoprotein N-acyltransferase